MSERTPSSSESGGGRRAARSRHSAPDYGSPLVQAALEHLASIDLIDLCNEAKIECCRATRDLSSCGQYVQHVLNACGHASLCAECSQRLDVCPVCRTPIPNDGNRLRLRLYYECIEAGLISRKHNERFQEKDVRREHMMADSERLYSLFDVALENNLVSLICHYVTDVCMDENAVSSDPVFAFLLDEVVVKDWCKQTFKSIVCDISEIYRSGVESMRSNLSQLQKFASHLAGVSNVLGAIASSFKNSYAAQLHDLHDLFENVLKTKQHLDVIIWCAQHQFLQGILPRFSSSAAWNAHVCERKLAALKRSWPDFSGHLADSGGCDINVLFIEEALSNLGIENEERVDGDVNISCLQDENSPLIFLSKIDSGSRSGCYPFDSLRIATDILFLHGTSDMVVAKHAIFLYYLFDRHWTRPDAEWKYLVDDFAASFGIARHSVLESLVFCLLDDHSIQVEEASNLLPEICGPEAHPKIARVLLERQRPDVALNFLCCSGRDGLCSYANSESKVTLGEAITTIRVRIECGLLTESFMYQRLYCSEVEDKHKQGVNLKTSNIQISDNWMYHVEVLVTEICYLCIRRDLVDRMIELPWNSTEEKYLNKCLLNYACQNPSSVHGSLLVVFYLQRYRYVEACQVDRALRALEQDYLENVDEGVASRMRLVRQWRAGLIEKCLELLPEIQRKKVMDGDIAENDNHSIEDFRKSIVPDLCNEQPDFPASLHNHWNDSSVIFQSEKIFPCKSSNVHMISSTDNSNSQSGSKVPSIMQQKLHAYSGSPVSSMDAIHETPLPLTLNREDLSSDSNVGEGMHKPDFKHAFRSLGSPLPAKFNLGTRTKLMKQMSRSIPRRPQNEDNLLCEKSSLNSGLFNCIPLVENGNITLDSHGFVHEEHPMNSSLGNHNQSDNFWSREEANINLRSHRKTPVQEQNLRGAPRWRSGNSSEEDEEDFGHGSTTNGDIVQRGGRLVRLLRR